MNTLRPPRPIWLGTLLLGALPSALAQNSDASKGTDTLWREVERHFTLHDQRLLAGDFDGLLELYDPHFQSPHFEVCTAVEMVRRWENLFARFSTLDLGLELHEIQQHGSWVAVSCCRPVRALAGDLRVDDNLCATFLLRRTTEGELRQAYAFGLDLDGRARRIAERDYAAEDLGFSLRGIPSLFTLTTPPGVAELDRLLFFDPRFGIAIDLAVMVPSLAVALDDALLRDCAPGHDDRYHWIRKPEEVRMQQTFEGMWARYAIGREAGAWDEREYQTTKLYARQDASSLFAFTLRAPKDRMEEGERLLLQLARGVERTGSESECQLELATVALHHHPEWQHVADGVWMHPTAPLKLVVPPTVHATSVPGALVERLLLRSDNAQVLLMVYDCGGSPPSPSEMMEDGLRNIRENLCGPTEEKYGEHSAQRVVLDRVGQSHELTVRCSASGRVVTHRLADVVRDGYHVFLQLVPSSTDAEAQAELFESVIGALEWTD